MSGIGAQVKNTVIKRNNFLPQMSLKAPIKGAERNESRPCKEKMVQLKIS